MEHQLAIHRSSAPVREQVAENLRIAIISGRFQPGERLREKVLCELTGTSRTSVREALRQLETEGLIEVIPNVGPIVSTISAHSARNIYQVRAELEALTGRLFAKNATDSQISDLESIVNEYTNTDRRDYAELVKLMEQFYDLLLEAAGNEEVSRVLGILRSRVSALRAMTLAHKGRFDKSVSDLREIIAAARSRDPERTAEACRNHVEAALSTALLVIEQESRSG